MTDLKDVVLAELASGTHTEAFADGARWAVQQAEKLAVHPAEPARPMPTREQIAEAMHDHMMESHGWRQGCRQDVCIDIFLDRAGAVLALLNGDES